MTPRLYTRPRDALVEIDLWGHTYQARIWHPGAFCGARLEECGPEVARQIRLEVEGREASKHAGREWRRELEAGAKDWRESR